MAGGSQGKEAKAAIADDGGLDDRDGENGKMKEISWGPRNHLVEQMRAVAGTEEPRLTLGFQVSSG